MKKEIPLQKEFVKWLVDTGVCKSNSALSYCDYINSANRSLDIYENENNEKLSLLTLLSSEIKEGNSDQMEEIIDDATEELSRNKIEKKLKRSLKYIQNWKSALNKYKEFLHDYLENEVTIDEEYDKIEEIQRVIEPNSLISTHHRKIRKSRTKGEVNNAKGSYTHTSKDLYDRFHFRIITQDRHYDEIYYPISFIKRFFYYRGEKKFMDIWVKDLLNEVNIHLEGDQIRLNQISKLEISDGKVQVEHNGVLKMVFTKKSDNFTLIPFSVGKLRFISLDHEDSLHAIMKNNIDNLGTFQEITTELKKHIGQRTTAKKYKKANNLVLDSIFINKLNIENLKAEMLIISKSTKLQLMDSSENTRKGQS